MVFLHIGNVKSSFLRYDSWSALPWKYEPGKKRIRTFLKTPVVFSGFSLLSLERSFLAFFAGVQDVVHLVFHVSIKWGVALLVHHFVVRQRLIEYSAFGWFFISVIQLLSTRSILANLVPRVLFLGFGGGAPPLQSQGKAPWERGRILAGFSVAFGSTGCSASFGGRAPFALLCANVECRRLHNRQTSEICKS